MSVKIINEDNKVIALLSGEIDHHNAKSLRQDIDFSLRENQPEELIMDFSEVGFMDSSGIGLVLGRYRQMKLLGGSVRVINIPENMYRLFALSGLEGLGVLR